MTNELVKTNIFYLKSGSGS